MIRCIIVDDEELARETLRKIIDRYFSEKLSVQCTAGSVKEAVDCIYRHNPDLVFLDIEMPAENGFRLFEYFDHYHFEVVFTTAYKDYAIDAIKNAALDYLLKPINYIDLKEAIGKVEAKIQTRTTQARVEALLSNIASGSDIYHKIALPTLEGYKMVKANDIIYCEADENYSKIHLNSGEVIFVPKTLKTIEDLLTQENFFRIHKSYIVNMNYIESYTRTVGYRIRLENGSELDVASRRNEEFLKALRREK